VLLVATALTLGLASVRAGLPTLPQLVAVVCVSLVVILQVVSAALRWSVRRPYPVDMRSARATPAPPLVMVGYSARLALSTTLTGMIFIGTSRAADWQWSVLVAIPFLLFSAYRLAGTARAWSTPETRARVVVTVAS
jgi:undecaprenyl pyrophosphate phosphatase UppP